MLLSPGICLGLVENESVLSSWHLTLLHIQMLSVHSLRSRDFMSVRTCVWGLGGLDLYLSLLSMVVKVQWVFWSEQCQVHALSLFCFSMLITPANNTSATGWRRDESCLQPRQNLLENHCACTQTAAIPRKEFYCRLVRLALMGPSVNVNFFSLWSIWQHLTGTWALIHWLGRGHIICYKRTRVHLSQPLSNACHITRIS